MKAIVIHEHGGPEVLRFEDVATPVPQAGEALIRLHATGVNHMEVDVRKGLSGYALRMPHVMGGEGAGEIVAVSPGITSFAPGDRVIPAVAMSSGTCRHPVCNCARGLDNLCLDFAKLGVTRWGTYAEYVTVGQQNLVRIPDGLSYRDAATSRTVFQTAWELVVEKGCVRQGEDVLVNGAAGGLASAALQVAKLAGARVIATAGSEEKVERVRALGADHAINYRAADWVERVREFTDGRGVDLAIETVGGEVLQKTLDAVAIGGRISVGGAHAGEIVAIDMVKFFRKQITMTSTHSAPKSTTARVLRLIADGRLQPVLAAEFPLREAAQAHTYLESRKAIGKIILIV